MAPHGQHDSTNTSMPSLTSLGQAKRLQILRLFCIPATRVKESWHRHVHEACTKPRGLGAAVPNSPNSSVWSGASDDCRIIAASCWRSETFNARFARQHAGFLGAAYFRKSKKAAAILNRGENHDNNNNFGPFKQEIYPFPRRKRG